VREEEEIMSEKGEKEIIIRLNVIVNLLSRLCIDKQLKSTVKQEIQLLDEMGLSSGDIARIIGREQNYVTSNLSRLKRRK
jgi:DNA-directed RNA polymerase specialized sigma24 family protein